MLIPHTSYCPRVAGVIKHPFSGCCLSGINMSHNTNVADSAGARAQIDTEAGRQWNGEKTNNKSGPTWKHQG